MSAPTVVLDGPLALRLLREVVAERPDYVYQGEKGRCLYIHAGQPSCLVGRVLTRHGVTASVLQALDDDEDTTIDTAYPVLERRGFAITKEAVRILTASQGVQDRIKPWRDALAVAEEEAARLGVSV
jgi:hypothetical protein